MEAEQLYLALLEGQYIPSVFPHLTPREFVLLHSGLRHHIEKLPKGWFAVILSAFNGENRRSQERLVLIARLAKITPNTASQAFLTALTACISNRTPESINANIKEVYFEGVKTEVLAAHKPVGDIFVKIVSFAVLCCALLWDFRYNN